MGIYEFVTFVLCVVVCSLLVFVYNLQRQVDMLIDITKIFDKQIEKSFEKAIQANAKETEQ